MSFSTTSRNLRALFNSYSLYNNSSNNNYSKLNKIICRKLCTRNVLFKKSSSIVNVSSCERCLSSNAATVAVNDAADKPVVVAADMKKKENFNTLSSDKSRKVVAERSFFDTYEFIQSLTQKGFTQQQAEQLCVLFKDIVNYIAQDIKKECVTKAGQDLAIQQVMIHISSLKKDMIILEKSEFYALRNENQKLQMDIKSIREQLNDEVVKLKGGFTLDINLEKNRSNEMTYEVTNRVHKLDSRIDSEISNVKALLESFKAETVRYIAGSLISGLVIILGALRYFSS